jgi:glycosyltransferase involved in cell wall biosynthesis
MLTSLGHTVYLYGARSTEEAPLEEYINSSKFHFVETHTVDDIRNDYGDGDNRFEIGYNWPKVDYRHDLDSTVKPSTQKFRQACIDYINRHKKPDDFLLVTMGQYHRPIADATKLFLKCESGIGYRGTCPEMFRCFESSFGQNFAYGSEHPFASIDGNYYDRVIPNYFERPHLSQVNERDYCLFIGRIIKRKGILTAYKACKAAGVKLKIAGQGGVLLPDGSLTNTYNEFVIPPDSEWEYVGYADEGQRTSLMQGAIATFVPTEYLEMFGGVNVESRLCGTPVITTDFGCFPEYVENGLDGYRCNTLDDFVEAVKRLSNLDESGRRMVQSRAQRFLTDKVKWEYQEWFDDLYNLYESAHIPGKLGWHRINNGN